MKSLPFSAASRKPPTNTDSGLHEFVIPASFLVILAIPLVIPAQAGICYHLGRGSPCPSHCHPGPVFNKSFPRCVSSLESRFTSFDCSLGKHTSRSKNKRWLWHTSAFSGKDIYYRSGQLQQAETLVTVSPCEFPPRCHPRLGRGSPCPSHCHPGPSYLSSPTWSGISPLSPHFTLSSFDIPENFI